MIRYALRCDQGHEFDGWFRSSDGFDSLRRAGGVGCTVCGSTQIEKTLMSPRVAAKSDADSLRPSATPALIEAKIAEMKRQIEANSNYVGLSFAAEARAMHEGQSPSRPIHGEAKPEEARKLIEDGVPIAPLPFIPRQKAN